jgi:hypothetical protein
MDLGEVTNKVTHGPPGTGGNGRIKPATPSGVSEELSFLLDGCDVSSDFHDVLQIVIASTGVEGSFGLNHWYCSVQ